MGEYLEPYDVNFYYPIQVLENERLKLTPFIPALHAEAYFSAIAPHPEAYTYIPFTPFPSIKEFVEWVEVRIRRDPALVLFAVIDKTRKVAHEQEAIAGIIGLMNTVPDHLSTEIGLLFTLPAYHGTHVTRNAVGLLMQLCFEELGMRRVQWRSDPQNVASIRVAERMGFRQERLERWSRVVDPGKQGSPVREADLIPDRGGIHILYLSICWDDWAEWKERVLEIMDSPR